MSYDKKSGELARHFLQDIKEDKLPPSQRPDVTVRLAQAIQDTVEDFLKAEDLA